MKNLYIDLLIDICSDGTAHSTTDFQVCIGASDIYDKVRDTFWIYINEAPVHNDSITVNLIIEEEFVVKS